MIKIYSVNKYHPEEGHGICYDTCYDNLTTSIGLSQIIIFNGT